MGKGRIVSGGVGGLYTVELLHNRERINAELLFLNDQLAALNAELAELETELAALVSARNAITAQIDATIAGAEEGEVPNVDGLLAQLAQASAQVQAQEVRIALVKGRRLEATKRKEQLEAVPEDPVQTAWCADYTEDLSGEVATVEVPAEGVVGQFLTWRRVQIRPGYEGRANYLPARDGQMFHREGQVGYQAFYNAAILPGVQRWKPQYRIATVASVNYEANACTINLQPEDSSAQRLLIDPPNLQYTYSNVPIEYMRCDARVFEPGDRVLVEFQSRDWQQPKVIGFEKEPKECPRFEGGLTLHFSMKWVQIEAVLESLDAWFNDSEVSLTTESDFYLSVGFFCRVGFGRAANETRRIPMTRGGFGAALNALRASNSAQYGAGWEDALDADFTAALGIPFLFMRPLADYEDFYDAVDTGLPGLPEEKRLLVNIRWEQMTNTTYYLGTLKPAVDAMTNHRVITLDYNFSNLDMSDASFMSEHETVLNAEVLSPSDTEAIRDLIIAEIVARGIAPEGVKLPE